MGEQEEKNPPPIISVDLAKIVSRKKNVEVLAEERVSEGKGQHSGPGKT